MDLISNYHDLTEWVKAFTGMPAELLHVHAGMALYTVSQFFLGSRRASWVALSIVFKVELMNEVMNYLFYGSWRWNDTVADIGITLLWPSICLAVGKYRRWHWKRRKELWRQRQERLRTTVRMIGSYSRHPLSNTNSPLFWHSATTRRSSIS